MQCENAQGLLSTYHDGELPAEQRIALEVHLESCPQCTAALSELRRLSDLASNLEDPQPPSELSDRIFERRQPNHGDVRTSKRGIYATIAALSVVAATVAIVIGIAAPWRHRGHVGHEDLAQYWESFQADPLSVQRHFLTRHTGRVVSADEAVREVGFRPLVTTQVPDTVRVETNYVLNMPCCKCIQTICRRPDGTPLAVFEHQAEQPRWFPGRDQVNMKCDDTKCQVTELESCLAASWPVGDRVVTIVGLRDVDELTRWVRALAVPQSPRQSSGVS